MQYNNMISYYRKEIANLKLNEGKFTESSNANTHREEYAFLVEVSKQHNNHTNSIIITNYSGVFCYIIRHIIIYYFFIVQAMTELPSVSSTTFQSAVTMPTPEDIFTDTFQGKILNNKIT